MERFNVEAYERRLRAQFVRRAGQTDAPLLAPALRRYALAEGQTWAELSQALGCSVDALNQIALCCPPRTESFVADVEAIAAGHADPDRLLTLLRRLQVFNAFAEHAVEALSDQNAEPERSTLLAARDRDEETNGGIAEVRDGALLPTDTEDDHA